MKRLLSGDLYSGAAAHIVTHSYWAVYYWCGGVAIFHQLAEWVYLSRPLKSLLTYLLGTIFVIGLVSGLIIQPRLEKVYAQKYARPGDRCRECRPTRFCREVLLRIEDNHPGA